MIVWGSNLPQTRTPDAHFYVEVRYRETKVVAISPDYAEFVKFADKLAAGTAGNGRSVGNGDDPRHFKRVLCRSIR